MMLFKTLFARAGLGLAASLLAGCVSLVPDQVYPVGTVAPLDAALIADLNATGSETIRTAAPGEILFEQAVSTFSVLTLDNDVETDGDVSLAVAARTVEFVRGMTFYPALSVGSRSQLAACSFDRPVTWTPRLNPGNSGRTKICFILEDLAARPAGQPAALAPDELDLDRSDLTASRFFFVSEPLGLAQESSPYQKLARWDPQLTYPVVEPARFTLTDAGDRLQGAPRIALRYVETAQGGMIEPVYVIDGQVAAMDAEPHLIDPNGILPILIQIEGARLQLLAVVDSVLAYRILSGFPSNQITVLDLPE